MYIAAKDFNSYKYGPIKKGQEIEKDQTWIDAGLIEEKPEKETIEIKPEPKKKKAKK